MPDEVIRDAVGTADAVRVSAVSVFGTGNMTLFIEQLLNGF